MKEPDPLGRPVSHHYRLDAKGEPVKCKTLREWCEFFEASEQPGQISRVVKRERVGACEVSTVFLALDHAFGGGPPVLWETMIFADAPNHAWHNETRRCAGGREQAEAMHAAALDEMKKIFSPTGAPPVGP
jgi:hypothetical protein